MPSPAQIAALLLPYGFTPTSGTGRAYACTPAPDCPTIHVTLGTTHRELLVTQCNIAHLYAANGTLRELRELLDRLLFKPDAK